MKAILLTLVLGASACSLDAAACDITLPSGSTAAAINSALSTHTVTCLAAGNYAAGTTQINVPAGKTLEGSGAAASNVVITSSASRAIVPSASAVLHNFTLTGPATGSATYGILVYQVNSVVIWSLNISGYLINIGVNGATGTQILDTFVSLNGIPNNGTADPNIWISSSPSTTLKYGAITGRGDKPFGDGEVSCYNSTNLMIDSTYSYSSGTSSFYLVNCDNATIQNTKIYNSGAFGLDIVGGTDNFHATNNLIQNAWYAGSVYANDVNTGGSYQNNTFTSNNVSGDTRFCSGIWLSASWPDPTFTGNTVTPLPAKCYH